MISRLINLRYEILERVGEGAFFQVYKARDKVMGRIVAVKTLQSACAHDADFCHALRKTAPAVTSLTHPNIARLYEVGEENGAPFLVTEFVRGINLKERIRRIAPFTLSVAVDFGIAVAEALHHAHAEGILHGDLRPQNVIISPEGAVKVTDFGMARVWSASHESAASSLARAVHYQAPELASGAPPSVSSDLYALGVILFEMLTGSLPYVGETPLLTAMKHQNEPIPSPRSLNPGVPRSLEGIVLKALQKRPDDRYRTTADLLNDLKSVRDALRFGKPLSWSPLEAEKMPAAAPAAPPPIQGVGSRVLGVGEGQRPTSAPVPEPAPVSGAARMSSTTVDDRISPYLKIALATVLIVLLVAGIIGAAVWMATFAKPTEQKFPNLVGMKWEEALQAAERANVRLVKHEEFNEKHDPGIVYQQDYEAGRPIRPGRSINVWVSRGSRMVWVPNLVNLSAEEAEAKLKENGMLLGAVNRAYHDKVPPDHVISQNPRAGKRVKRDQAVNLTMSDGPKIEEPPVEPSPSAFPDGGAFGGPTDEGMRPEDWEPRSFNLSIKVKPDGLGMRQVRVEYEDARGVTQTPIDEMHNENDEIARPVEVYGRQITVRVYYNDELKSERTYRLPRRAR